jgi:DNA-binding response OmpR family regulator
VIADDNRDAADSLALLLQLSGYGTFVAYNGQQALDLGAREHPRAFILDVGMPDMTGTRLPGASVSRRGVALRCCSR